MGQQYYCGSAPRRIPISSGATLFFLEPVGGEAQSATVLGHRPDDMFGSSVGNLGLDLKGDMNLCSDEAREVCENLFGDAAGVAAHSRGVELNTTVEPSWPGRFRARRSGLIARSRRCLAPFLGGCYGAGCRAHRRAGCGSFCLELLPSQLGTHE